MESSDGTLVELRQATLGYGRRAVLTGIDLTLRQGDFLGLVGPNGSGKTTILRALLGLLQPMAGEVRRAAVDGKPLMTGYVPQRDAGETHFPTPVREVVMMGRYRLIGALRRPSRQDRERVEEALEQTGISDLARQPFHALSGGQRQRTLIARALASEAPLMVLDEPTNGMDLASETVLLELLARLHQEQGLTVVLVTHLLHSAAAVAKQIGILHEGRLRVGPLAELLTSEMLTTVYGMPVEVHQLGRRLAIVPQDGVQ